MATKHWRRVIGTPNDDWLAAAGSMAQQMSCGPWQLFKDQQGESERSEGNVCQSVRYLGIWCIIGLVG